MTATSRLSDGAPLSAQDIAKGVDNFVESTVDLGVSILNEPNDSFLAEQMNKRFMANAEAIYEITGGKVTLDSLTREARKRASEDN